MARNNYKFSNLFLAFSVFIHLQSVLLVEGFFIDLEALGFSSKSDEATQETSPVLIAAPSEQQMVEIDSKTDPNKSVKLTLAELKQLIMGSVKDMTPNPPPINIKISASKDQPLTLTTMATTTTPIPIKINKYKYQNAMAQLDGASDGTSDFDEHSSYLSKRPSSASFVSLEDHSNEVLSGGVQSSGNKDSGDEDGWLSTAKAVFRGPSHVVNSYSKSFSRWRGGGKLGKQKKKPQYQRRPLADITYQSDKRRRRKRPPPRSRRPSRPRRPSGYGQRRRAQVKRQRHRLPTYHHDEQSDFEYFDEYRSAYPHTGYGNGNEAWDRMDDGGHMEDYSGGFDSTAPQDDTPFNMSPPLPYYNH